MKYADFLINFDKALVDNGDGTFSLRTSVSGGGTVSGTLTVTGLTTMSGGTKYQRVGSGAGNYVVLSSDYIVGKTGITAGGDSVTLPSAVTAGNGRVYVIKDESGTAATNNITVSSASGNIDGVSTFVMTTNYQSITVHSDGTNWFIE